MNKHDLLKVGKLEAWRKSRLLSPTASRDTLSGAFFFACKGKRWKRFYRQEISAGLNTTSLKSVYMYVCRTQVLCMKCVVSPTETWDNPPNHPLCLILASICVERATFKLADMGGEQLINIFGFVGVGQWPWEAVFVCVCTCVCVWPVAPPLLFTPHYPLLSEARLSCIMQREQGGSH